MNAPKTGTKQTQDISTVEFTVAELDAVSGGRKGLDRATYEWLKANYFPFMFKVNMRNVC